MQSGTCVSYIYAQIEILDRPKVQFCAWVGLDQSFAKKVDRQLVPCKNAEGYIWWVYLPYAIERGSATPRLGFVKGIS